MKGGGTRESALPAGAARRCPRCGEANAAGASYCMNCGAEMTGIPALPVPPARDSPGTSLKGPVPAVLTVTGLAILLVAAWVLVIAPSGSAAHFPAGETGTAFPPATGPAGTARSPDGSPFEGYGNTLALADAGNGFSLVTFRLALAPGSQPVDFTGVVVRFSTDTSPETLAAATPLMTESPAQGGWSVSSVTGDSADPDTILEPGEVFTISARPGRHLGVSEKFTLSVQAPGQPEYRMTRTMPATAQSGMNVVY